MLADLAEAIRAREERVTIGGVELVVRELATAADVAAFADNEDLTYKLLVRCAFGPDGVPAFTDADIPALKAASKVKLLPLIDAVRRVNGADAEAEVKN